MTVLSTPNAVRPLASALFSVLQLRPSISQNVDGEGVRSFRREARPHLRVTRARHLDGEVVAFRAQRRRSSLGRLATVDVVRDQCGLFDDVVAQPKDRRAGPCGTRKSDASVAWPVYVYLLEP